MKPLLVATLALTSALISLKSQAQTTPGNPDCADFHLRFGAFHYQRFQATDGTCFLSADPFEVGDFRYRSYLATNDGMLMVFNSYSPSDSANASGARVFHFFPRKNMPEITNTDTTVNIKTATPGIELVLSQDQTKIIKMVGGLIKEDSKVSSANKGGVEIISAQSLYLDSGFAVGHDITADLGSTSTFHDSKGRTCDVKNREIFNVTSDGDSELKFSDSELKAFLKTRCPRLKPGF